MQTISTVLFLAASCCLLLAFPTATAFQPTTTQHTSAALYSPLFMSTTAEEKPKEGYVPKWKKKKTLADDSGNLDFSAKGIKGTVPVLFKQGDVTKSTMAMPGQPLRDVATQAGQFIKYGCGKGECGTCEAMCNGKWVRPCKDVVPVGLDAEEEIVVTVKDIASKTTSSGQFFSIKSFFMGFYNNVLGMVGFVKYRQNAKKNWEERQEYEDLIRTLTLEKRKARLARQGYPELAAKVGIRSASSDEHAGLSP